MPRGDYHFLTCATVNTYCLAAEGQEYRPKQKLGPKLYREKLSFFQTMLGTMGYPQLLVLQEVYHRKALDDLLGGLPQYSGASVIMPQDELHEPRVAIVTCLPVQEQQVICEFPPEAILAFGGQRFPVASFRRPVPSAVLQLPDGLSLRVFGFHWKSQLGIYDDGEDKADLLAQSRAKQRAAIVRGCESAALRLIGVKDLTTHDRPLLFAGDCNSDAADGIVQNFLGETPWSGMSRPEAEAVWKTKYWDIGSYFSHERGLSALFTHHHNGRYARFDAAMTSYHLYGPSPHSIGHFEDYWVYADHLQGAFKGWRASTVHRSRSDHAFPWFKLAFKRPQLGVACK